MIKQNRTGSRKSLHVFDHQLKIFCTLPKGNVTILNILKRTYCGKISLTECYQSEINKYMIVLHCSETIFVGLFVLR